MQNERLTSVLSYVFVIGWVYALIAGPQSRLVRFHLKQSIGMVLYTLGAFILWALVAWLAALIPFAGMMLAVFLFSLVVVVLLSLLPIWLVGLINAARGQYAVLPIMGSWANSLPFLR